MEGNPETQNSPAALEEPEQESQPQQPPLMTNEQKQWIRARHKAGQEWKAAQRKREFEDRRTRIAEMLLPENRDKPVVISSCDDYVAMDAAYKSLSNRTDMDEQTMEDYPKADGDWVALTTRLTAAITDFTSILDKPQKNMSNEGNTAVKLVKSLSTLEVQLLAGKILMATRDAHVGRYNIPSWPKLWKQDSCPSFEERFREVCNALTHSKAIVKSIMDAEFPFVMRFATAPRGEFKMKKVNKIVNDKRAETRKQMKKRTREDDEDGDNDGDTAPQENSEAPAFKPRKRSYIMKKGAAQILQGLHSNPNPSQPPSAGPSTVSSPIQV